MPGGAEGPTESQRCTWGQQAKDHDQQVSLRQIEGTGLRRLRLPGARPGQSLHGARVTGARPASSACATAPTNGRELPSPQPPSVAWEVGGFFGAPQVWPSSPRATPVVEMAQDPGPLPWPWLFGQDLLGPCHLCPWTPTPEMTSAALGHLAKQPFPAGRIHRAVAREWGCSGDPRLEPGPALLPPPVGGSLPLPVRGGGSGHGGVELSQRWWAAHPQSSSGTACPGPPRPAAPPGSVSRPLTGSRMALRASAPAWEHRPHRPSSPVCPSSEVPSLIQSPNVPQASPFHCYFPHKTVGPLRTVCGCAAQTLRTLRFSIDD